MGDEEGEHGKKSDCVKVAIRCRPLSQKELGNNENSIVEMEENADEDGTGGITISDPDGKERPAQFAFDIVFGTQCEQVLVYDTVGKPAIESTLNGYNGTIFAYGQTGSGKSWCMTGGSGDLRGIIPRVNEQLFERIDREQEVVPTRRFLVMCSFFEIYNEIIFDLLNPVQDRSKLGAGLQVKEHPVLGIYVKDLQEIVVTDSDKLEKLMASGTKNRAVSSTMMNATSSRSHSIFTIKVHQKDDEDKSKNVFAKLNLVDLAGSERQKGTGATGQTLKEGANINKSLSALGNVINALVENANGKKVFVPYRNSKLTRVLQESLGGNSLCTMLATLSPAACNFEETLSTLRYANRAKAIKVSATKNEEASQISRLNVEIEELKKKLLAAASGGGGAAAGVIADDERQLIKEKFASQIAEMESMINSTWEEKSKLSQEHEAQLSKAQEQQKRQARVMEEEGRKRFRLLQEQNDIELSLRALLDTLQSLPSKAEGSGAADRSALLSGEMPRQWLKMAATITEANESLKQQHTMALMFQGAFSEDLRLWIDGGEASDSTMARTGVQRATKKMETFRKECEKLAALETEGQTQAQKFAEAVAQARNEWTSTGRDAVVAQWRESAGNNDGEEQNGQRELPALLSRALEDIGRIMQLAEQQAQARWSDFNSLAVMEMRAPAELVLRGVSLVSGCSIDHADDALLRSLTGEHSPARSPSKSSQSEASPKVPREQRQLHEWNVEDVDSSVEGTEFALSQLVELQGLNKKRTPQELLSRPPPKFVHDVAVLVRQATGFLPALSEIWPEPREEKLDLLQHISDTCAAGLGLDSIDFDPADVLKGKEVEKTLRLLQMLAVAAAREKRGGAAGEGSKVHRDRRKGEGLTGAGDMHQVLDTIARCMQRASDIHEAQRADEQRNGTASPTRELENSLAALQEKVEEELRIRAKQEQRIAELQKQLDGARNVLGERHVQLDHCRQVAGEKVGKKEDLRKKVDQLRSGLLHRAQMSGNAEVTRLRKELEDVAHLLAVGSQAKAQLASEVKKLTQQRLEAETERETFEDEVKRMKLRMAQGLEAVGGNKLHNTEEILILQAEKQKLDVRIVTLEEKLRNMTEADDLERQKETALLEENKIQSSKNDENQMQLQVIVEERDALREGMDQLWQEKIRLSDELEYRSERYTDITDTLAEKADEKIELEKQLQEYDNLLSMLQENYEKNRHSPVMTAPETQSPAPAAAVVAPPAKPPAPVEPPPAVAAVAPPKSPADGGSKAKQSQAAGSPTAEKNGKAAADNDDGSSHYSDEDFEEYAEDDQLQ